MRRRRRPREHRLEVLARLHRLDPHADAASTRKPLEIAGGKAAHLERRHALSLPLCGLQVVLERGPRAAPPRSEARPVPSPLSSRAAPANIQGSRSAARPIMTPSTPVASIMARASSGCMTSPFPITGMDTASFTARIAARSVRPEYCCSRVRPCTATASAPAASRARAATTLWRRVVPARSDLHRDGDVDAGPDGLDHPSRARRILEQGGAGIASDDLADGASHVHVDQIGAPIDEAFGRLRQDVGLAAGDLHARRALLGAQLREGQRPRVIPHDSVGHDHLGGREPAPQALHDAAERQIRESGHGSQQERRIDHQPSDPQRTGARRSRRGDVFGGLHVRVAWPGALGLGLEIRGWYDHGAHVRSSYGPYSPYGS